MNRYRLNMSEMAKTEMPDPILWEPGMALQTDQPYVVGGLTIFLEYLAGDMRKGVDAQGSPWESVLPAHYGHIVDTVGGDGEELDIYIKDADCDWSADVHVIDQLNLTTGNWDEHKIMIGFSSAQEAEETYVKAFSDEKGIDRLAATCTLCADTFLLWVYSGSTQSAMSTQEIPDMVVRVTDRGKDAIGHVVSRPQLPAVPGRFGAVPVQLCPTQALSICDLSQGETLRYAIYLFGPLDVGSRERPVYNDLVRLLRLAPEQARFDFYIASPGGCLVEAMRFATAMRTSRAKVVTHAVGPVCSAAVILWAEGHERHVGSCAYFMQHMSSHGQSGKSSQIAQRAMTIVHYLRHTVLQRQLDVGLWTEQEISDLIDKSTDLYITADEAVRRMGN